MCDRSNLPHFQPDRNVQCCFQYYVYYMYTQSQTDISSVLWNDSPNRNECPMKFHKVLRTLIVFHKHTLIFFGSFEIKVLIWVDRHANPFKKIKISFQRIYHGWKFVYKWSFCGTSKKSAIYGSLCPMYRLFVQMSHFAFVDAIGIAVL